MLMNFKCADSLEIFKVEIVNLRICRIYNMRDIQDTKTHEIQQKSNVNGEIK